jgi:hypothetical protein
MCDVVLCVSSHFSPKKLHKWSPEGTQESNIMNYLLGGSSVQSSMIGEIY